MKKLKSLSLLAPLIGVHVRKSPRRVIARLIGLRLDAGVTGCGASAAPRAQGVRGSGMIVRNRSRRGYTRGCRGTGRRSVGVINGEARRSGAVFRRVTPWRSHRSVRATARNVGRRVRARIERRARPKINPGACQVLAPVAAKRKPIGERWLSPHEELTRGRRTTFGDEGRIGRDAEKIPRQVRPQDPAGKRSCFLCETFSTLLQCVAPFRARTHARFGRVVRPNFHRKTLGRC